MTGGAVGQEDLSATRDSRFQLLGREALGAVVLRGWDSWTGTQRRNVRREGGDLLLGVHHRLAGGLSAGLRERHATGAQLEVGTRCSDSDQGWAIGLASHRLDALTVASMAERAADEEEFTSLRDHLRVGFGAGRLRGTEGGIEAAAEEQSAEDNKQTGSAAPTMSGEPPCGPVDAAIQEAHDQS